MTKRHDVAASQGLYGNSNNFGVYRLIASVAVASIVKTSLISHPEKIARKWGRLR
jgi:hypothetical protein